MTQYIFTLLYRYKNIAYAELEDTPNKQNSEISTTFLGVLKAKKGYILEKIPLKVRLESFTIVYNRK